LCVLGDLGKAGTRSLGGIQDMAACLDAPVDRYRCEHERIALSLKPTSWYPDYRIVDTNEQASGRR